MQYSIQSLDKVGSKWVWYEQVRFSSFTEALQKVESLKEKDKLLVMSEFYRILNLKDNSLAWRDTKIDDYDKEFTSPKLFDINYIKKEDQQ